MFRATLNRDKRIDRTAPGLTEADCRWFRGDVFSGQSRVRAGLRVRPRDRPYGPEKTTLVEPIDPAPHRILDGLEAPPRAAAMGDVCLADATASIDRGVVLAVAYAAEQRPRCQQPRAAPFSEWVATAIRDRCDEPAMAILCRRAWTA